MQHRINPAEHGPHGQTMADAVQACVHCGFCLAACPTYDVLGEEMDSPRGRIYLMKEVLEGNLPAEEAQPYIDRCLGCVGCVPACPSGVPYGELLMGYRAKTEATRTRPLWDQVSRKLIVETLPHPGRFRTAVRTGHIGRALQKALPAPFQSMLNFLPDQLPPAETYPAVIPAQGTRRARVALLIGCVQQVLAPQINTATIALLTANGVEVVVPPSQGCCGSILMHIGEEKAAQKLATRNLAAFDPNDVDAIITNAAGCGSGMKEYGLLFEGQAQAEQAQAFAAQVRDITTFLADLGLRPFPADQPARLVAYHDACHLRHAQGVQAAPRQLLQAIPNLTLLELDDEGLCCGSAGTYNLEQPDIAAELGRRKAERIGQTGAEMVVSGNIGCLTQIQRYLGEVPLRHTAVLLAEAYQRSTS